jgi:hypothetical protein
MANRNDLGFGMGGIARGLRVLVAIARRAGSASGGQIDLVRDISQPSKAPYPYVGGKERFSRDKSVICEGRLKARSV